ncbi:MAG TPA: hypothetical protein DIU15_13365, partial [Deltaproteobacteria bacterium]|nr:hypothetical protein [Deltaproteobacteria bacterium]
TVPAYFNDRQRQAVRSAGKLAGLNVLRVLNEPTSAALAYGLGKNLRQRLAVYDLGGGTFDISIIEIRDKVFEVIASGGDTYLGGIDFDDRIIGHVIEAFGNEHGIDLSTDRIAIQRIREAAERAKITLSTTQQANIEVPFIARGPNGILNLEHVLARDQLEALVDDLVKRTVSACESIFKDAGLGPETIDEVLIVGGQSRMPLVLSRVKTYFQKEPCKGVHPDEAVAVGAAIMAHSLTSNMGEQVTLLDVLPMAIGIAKGDGSFLPLFPRNCPIPHGRKLTLTNSKDDQKSIMLRVFQGDEKLAADNELLGTFVFSGMRQGPRGSVRVQTWLNVDSEGILSVSAKDKDTEEPLDVKLKLRQQDLAPNLSIQTTTAGDDAPATRRTAPPPPSTEDTGPSAADSKSDSSPTPPAPTDDAKTSPARFGSIAGDDSDAPTPPPSEESPTAHATNKDEASDSTQESSPSSGVVSRASDQTDSAGPPA